MPEPISRRGDAVTGSRFTGPFENILYRLGVGGLNLKAELDVIGPDQFSRASNIYHDGNGGVTTRPGLQLKTTAGTEHHSLRRLRDPASAGATLITGVDDKVYLGLSGALTQVDTGYSGFPLALVPHRPPLSGQSWMFVADSARMRKVRYDGVDLEIGLAAPATAAVVVPGIEYRTNICLFEASDATDAANWTGVAGRDTSGKATGTPIKADVAGPVSGSAVYFTTAKGTAATTYDSWWGCPITRDLSQVSPLSGGGSAIPAADDDLIHLWLKTSHPHLVQEVRVYLVCSATFSPSTLPGTGSLGSEPNQDAYVKSCRPNDFITYIQTTQTQIVAAETSRLNAIRDLDLDDRGQIDKRDIWAIARAANDVARAKSLQLGTGSHQWLELGSIGIPLRRGDFQRIGSTAGRDWATITGILVYVLTNITPLEQIVAVAFDELYLTGGFGPDTMEPGAQQYDWRYTNYDPRTGAESNGSPTMATADYRDSARAMLQVTPAAYGDAAVRQRVYRRGGTLIDDWYYEGENTADGGAFNAIDADDAIVAAGTLPTDHYQPVPTVDSTGATVLAQPVRALWGPAEGMLFACGDPYRPGHLYYCIPDEPDHWSADGNVEVCSPGEELMNGGLIAHQAFVFSRERLYMLYPNLTGDVGVTATPSACKRGPAGYWAFCTGPGGIYFVAQDGVFVTSGGPEEWLSEDIDPLFHGDTARYGYWPIDFDAPSAIKCTVWENKLYIVYQAQTTGQRHLLVYHTLKRFWLWYNFAAGISGLQGDGEEHLLVGSLNTGRTWMHRETAQSDEGTAITASFRTGALDGNAREEKLLGDMIVDANGQGRTVTVTNYLNEENVINVAATLTTDTNRTRYILDCFGDVPQHSHSLSTGMSWSSGSGQTPPTIYRAGFAFTMQPDLTVNRVTNWDDIGHPDEVWLTGVTFDCDTAGESRTIIVERDFNGARTTVAELTVQTWGRHKVKFSWEGVPANQVRIRPNDDCRFWLLYRVDWIYKAEPPRVAHWDIHWENAWDQYYTGLDIYCDTGGITKTVVVEVDGVALTNPETGLAFYPVMANGRKVVHLTLPWGRGHVFRFHATDESPGLLYAHRWMTTPEPSEQANWNQNFTLYGSRADKYLKAIIFECDTYGANKSVRVEADGALVEILSVNANGRQVVQLTLTEQALGRVWRMYPADGNPGRLYSVQPIFDEEPFKLARWETQETNHGLPGWFQVLWGHVTLKSTQDVVLSLTLHHNQADGATTKTYTLPATGGVKRRLFVSFEAGKGVLAKYLLTSAAAFFLYREETTIHVQPWGREQEAIVQPFGSDDKDPPRPMDRSADDATTTGAMQTVYDQPTERG